VDRLRSFSSYRSFLSCSLALAVLIPVARGRQHSRGISRCITAEAMRFSSRTVRRAVVDPRRALQREMTAADRIPYGAHVSPTIVRTQFAIISRRSGWRTSAFETRDDTDLNNWHERAQRPLAEHRKSERLLVDHLVRRRGSIEPLDYNAPYRPPQAASRHGCTTATSAGSVSKPSWSTSSI